MGCPSKLQRSGTSSVWPSLVRLRPLNRHPKVMAWPLAYSRSRLGPTRMGRTQSSHMDLPSPSETHLTSSRPKSAPLMSFPAPTAHQAREIHQHGFPCPLWSAYAVGPALTVCSPPDPAGLFHPAALLGFQTAPLHDSCPEGQERFTRQSTLSLHARRSPATEVAGEGALVSIATAARRLQRRCPTGAWTTARKQRPGDTLRSASHPSRRKAGTSPGRVIEL